MNTIQQKQIPVLKFASTFLTFIQRLRLKINNFCTKCFKVKHHYSTFATQPPAALTRIDIHGTSLFNRRNMSMSTNNDISVHLRSFGKTLNHVGYNNVFSAQNDIVGRFMDILTYTSQTLPFAIVIPKYS